MRESDLIPYIDEDGSRKVVTFATDLLFHNTGGWHYVYENTTLSSVDVVGDNRIILKDGVTLTVPNGIHVEGTLTIYGQDNQSGRIVVSTNSNNAPAIGGEGASIVINGGSIDVHGGVGYRKEGVIGEINAYADGREMPLRETGAGIGGKGADVTITGGTVVAEGGYGGAGIGGGGATAKGGKDGKAGGEISIRGADTRVSSSSVYGAGIGSSGAEVGINNGNGAPGGTITIDDGYVCAVSAKSGAGIGGGCKGTAGSVTINGGYVVASGGSFKYSWIEQNGFGSNDSPIFDNADDSQFYGMIADLVLEWMFSAEYSGAGIGGGSHQGDGSVRINGGTVVAIGGQNVCSAIGWGKDGSHTIDLGIYEYSKTTYGNLNSDGDIAVEGVVYGGSNGVPVAKNNTYAKIEPCEHFIYFDMGGILPDPAPLKLTGAIIAAMPSLAGAVGYFFDGWFTDAGFTTPFDPDAPITDWDKERQHISDHQSGNSGNRQRQAVDRYRRGR